MKFTFPDYDDILQFLIDNGYKYQINEQSQFCREEGFCERTLVGAAKYGSNLKSKINQITNSKIMFLEHYEIAEKLIKYGADVNGVDSFMYEGKRKFGASPLYWAAMRSKDLHEKHTKLRKTIDEQYCIIFLLDNKKMARLFLENGADIRAEGYGGSPLDVAVRRSELF